MTANSAKETTTERPVLRRIYMPDSMRTAFRVRSAQAGTMTTLPKLVLETVGVGLEKWNGENIVFKRFRPKPKKGEPASEAMPYVLVEISGSLHATLNTIKTEVNGANAKYPREGEGVIGIGDIFLSLLKLAG